MKLNDYQREAVATAFYPALGIAVYPALGLAGEAGEFAEKVKKLHRDMRGCPTQEWQESAKKELGDVLWYVAAAAHELGFSLEDVATTGLAKLASRAARGKLAGSGDDR
jgi:NTP pyrophosphatase (non-canonical NTP hydrolase)